MKQVVEILKWFALIVAISVCIYIPFANPELTNTQLILKFWYVYLIAVGLAFIWMYKRKL